MSLIDRLQHAFNVFAGRDPTYINVGPGTSYRPDRLRLSRGNEKSIVTSVYTRLAVDAAQIKIRHVQLDENGRYLHDIDSGLNNCLSLEANIDQTSRALFLDIILSMLDEGCIAVVPVDTTINPSIGSFDINSMRVAKIIEWHPDSVKVRIYNEHTGKDAEVLVKKSTTAIIENPFYAVMNEPNSTAKRLMRKLALLDFVDEQNGAGKLDMVIQLPYIIKTEARKKQAEERRKSIEAQLAESKYGIAYTDGTEKITQLNRSVDNQLLTQIESLTKTLYAQLGLTEEIMNGTANGDALNNYYARTIEPILSAIVDEFKRKFLTKTARTQHKSVEFFRDPFTLMPISEIPETADKLTRNEILTSNEVRQLMGMKPSEDPRADELRNSNISEAKDQERIDVNGNKITNLGGNQNEERL